MCPVKPSGKRSAEKANEAAKQWKDVPIHEKHYMDGAKRKPAKRKRKEASSKSDLSRFGDWDQPNVLLVKSDDPLVQECLEFQKKFHTPKEELDNWLDNPPDLSNTFIHKKDKQWLGESYGYSTDKKLAKLDQEFSLVPRTNAGRVSSTVRWMKAEKEMGIPIRHRTGFAISTKTGKGANEMSGREWDDSYKDLCDDLKRQYPETYQHIFPAG